MIKIESRMEFGAHEITAADFDSEPSSRPPIRGVIWRDTTRTVRLTNPSEIDDQEDDEPEEGDEIPRKRPFHRESGGVRPYSFYGIGCFIIVKNGKAIGMMSPRAFNARYRSIG